MRDRIKAIPTTYKGVKFRSKLEARVAETFDAARVKWIYEAEGYDIDGVWYLPDFWLPEHKSFVEVKGLIDGSVSKTIALAKSVPHDVRVFLATAEHINGWSGIRRRLSRLDRWGRTNDAEIAHCGVCDGSHLLPIGKKHCFGIYLAGKVRSSNDWRYGIFPYLARLSCNTECVVKWAGTKDQRDSASPSSMPLGKEHYYLGPYFAQDHEDSGDHKAGFGHFTKHDAGECRRRQVYEMARDAIGRCDLFFAWIDDSTCHGTLVEIGIASALGKPVYIGSPGDVDVDELWFAREAGLNAPGRTALEALRFAIKRERE